ncbi:2-succinyl-6-hydroxy-2,4-cyclohexadiene-1-carboxylate synthase [Salinivibrio kushneri]|uniref:2-succinyl-6-hydroxy-2, 4-cyclohexadiene-1-carboxylate synthase n=1 Tax=Salinivibrio kushneri TaxID=1908198 RepID=UPI0022B50AE3|nr:2-succinyl-6-hydroxy-2,4-cyclohexadiene-1-carboxylate synthase [Salinivibrio kushneri]WBA11003.1 2-succinyl-6-hydroxy-2,4-cyclohexadiene-1-carboxylate synthase [Salinivibrio kushneri]
MLSYQQGGDRHGKKVVFLHGFLGSGEDWRTVTDKMRHCHWLCIDLPGHGGSVNYQVVDFATTVAAIRQTCHQVWGHQRACLVGYSLGARLAMHLVCTQPSLWHAVFLEAGHPGLTGSYQRRKRLAQDSQWAERFAHQAIDVVLAEWYRQPVFHSLTDAQRADLVAARRDNHGPAVAKMLMATSLGRQANLRAGLGEAFRQGVVIDYLCGEHDNKFTSLAHSLWQHTGIPATPIEGAGHNSHVENPDRFVQVLTQSHALA